MKEEGSRATSTNEMTRRALSSPSPSLQPSQPQNTSCLLSLPLSTLLDPLSHLHQLPSTLFSKLSSKLAPRCRHQQTKKLPFLFPTSRSLNKSSSSPTLLSRNDTRLLGRSSLRESRRMVGPVSLQGIQARSSSSFTSLLPSHLSFNLTARAPQPSHPRPRSLLTDLSRFPHRDGSLP